MSSRSRTAVARTEKAHLFLTLTFWSVAVLGAASISLVIPLQWAPALAVGVLGVALAILGPRCLMALMLVLSGVSFSALSAGMGTILPDLVGSSLDGLRLVVAIGAFALLCVRQPSLLSSYRILAIFLIYLGWSLLSITWAPSSTEAIRYAAKLFYPVVCYFMASHIAAHSQSDFVLKWIRNGLLVAVVLNLLAAVAFGNMSPGTDQFRFRGMAGPNTIGLFSAMTGVAMYAWFVQTRARSFLVAWMISIAQLVATGSRTAMMGAAAALVVFESTRGKLMRAASVSILAGCVWFLVPTLGHRTSSVGILNTSSGLSGVVETANLSGRLVLWRDVWVGMVLGADPWGRGLASTIVYLEGRYAVIRGVHNVYLQTLAETGPIGLSLFGTAMASLVLFSARQQRRYPVAGSLALAGLACFLVASLADNVQGDYASFAAFPLAYLGLLAGHKA